MSAIKERGSWPNAPLKARTQRVVCNGRLNGWTAAMRAGTNGVAAPTKMSRAATTSFDFATGGHMRSSQQDMLNKTAISVVVALLQPHSSTSSTLASSSGQLPRGCDKEVVVTAQQHCHSLSFFPTCFRPTFLRRFFL